MLWLDPESLTPLFLEIQARGPENLPTGARNECQGKETRCVDDCQLLRSRNELITTHWCEPLLVWTPNFAPPKTIWIETKRSVCGLSRQARVGKSCERTISGTPRDVTTFSSDSSGANGWGVDRSWPILYFLVCPIADRYLAMCPSIPFPACADAYER